MKLVAPVLPGETLAGKYRVERILGQGGMGVVVAAKHIDLDERVAIKFLLGEPSTAAVDRFLREARAAVKVKGEHVCRVLDFGRLETGEPYIVMEHLEGLDLARLLEKEGAQPVAAAVGWIVEASDALAEAHALGIIHRDVKPANVFLAKRRDGTTSAKVLDFGISKLPSQTQLTGTQATLGTPAYMSPEQMVSAHDVDARTDIWSLGATLYELLAGAPPFVADSIVQLTVTVREKEPPPIEGIPEGLAKVLARCLAKAPADRYESVEALVADLAPFAPTEVSGLVARHARRESLSGGAAALAVTARESRVDPVESAGGRARGTFAPLQSTLADEPPSAERRQRRRPMLVAVAGVVGLLVAGGAVLSRSSTPPALSAAQEAALPSATDARAELDAALVAPVTPTAVASATASTVSLPSAPKVPPRASATTVIPAPAPIASLRVDASVAPEPPSSAPSAPPAKPSAPKRRELDREDP
jgi:eukaryotic-like serine/threonine-protein kinase